MAIVKQCAIALVALALILTWGASAGANFAAGMQSAGSSPYRIIWGLVSLSADIFKVFVLFVLGYSWRRRQIGRVMLCLVIWAGTTLYGLQSCAIFVATTLSDTASNRGVHRLADDSIARLIAAQEHHVQDLQAIKLKQPARDWPRYEEEINRAQDRLEAYQRQARSVVTIGDADPLATLLARFGVTEQDVRLARLINLLIVFEVTAAIGLVVFGPMIGLKNLEDMTGQLVERAEFMAPAAAALEARRTAPSKTRPKPQPAASLKVAASQTQDQLEASQFMAWLESRYGSSARVPMEQVLDDYERLAKERRWKQRERRDVGYWLRHMGVSKDGSSYVLERKTPAA